MYVADNTEGGEAQSMWFYAAALILGLLAAFFVMSFIPGTPKSFIVGHEFGTAKTGMPLRLPIIRPVYLARGQGVSISYSAAIRAGSLGIDASYSPSMLSFVMEREKFRITSVRMSASGAARFSAQRSGYYVFTAYAEPNSTRVEHCADMLKTLWNSIQAAPSSCPTYNASFMVTIRQ